MSTRLFRGEGSFHYGGRWNSKGRRIVYAGGNPAIAALEVIVHLEELSDLNRLRYVLVPVEHSDFNKIVIGRPELFEFDSRLKKLWPPG